MYDVIKRNGKKVKFNKTKIEEAIKKAFIAVNREYDQDIIELLVLRTCADFERKIIDKKINVEDIQDSVEKTLSESNYADVAKAYILYRKQREKARNIDSALSTYNSLVNSYVDLNSDKFYSVCGLVKETSGAITSNYWLSEIYDEQISNAYKANEINILNLDMLTGDSIYLPLAKIIKEGINGTGDNISSGPSKHLSTLCNQLVNLLSIIQNEWATSLNLKSFDTLLADYISYEKLSYDDVKSAIESFIYGINMPTCLGGKAPNVNIFLDYGKSKEEKMINKAILEILIHGDYKHHAFTNPKFYYMFDNDYKFKYDDVDLLLLEYACKYNEIYFINKKYYKEIEGLYGLVEIKTNYESIDDLNRRIDIACRSLNIKKEIIKKLFKNGLYPYTSKYLKNIDNLSSAIALRNIENMDSDVINHIKEILVNLNKKYNSEYKLVLLDNNIYTNDDVFLGLEENEDKYSLFDCDTIYNVYLNDNKPTNKALGSLIEKLLNNYKLTCFVLRKNKG